jgi:hypothetical protein
VWDNYAAVDGRRMRRHQKDALVKIALSYFSTFFFFTLRIVGTTSSINKGDTHTHTHTFFEDIKPNVKHSKFIWVQLTSFPRVTIQPETNQARVRFKKN